MDLCKEVVQILVGQGRAPFVVHKKLLRQHSEYFSRAFGANSKEGQDRLTELPDISEAIFRLFLKWLYMQMTREVFAMPASVQKRLARPNALTIEETTSDPGTGHEATGGPATSDLAAETNELPIDDLTAAELSCRILHDNVLETLLNLYTFADAYETISLRNDIMSALHVLYKYSSDKWAGLKIVPRAYNNLSATSQFCKSLVLQTSLYWDGEYEGLTETQVLELPKECLVSVLSNSARIRYHVQEEDDFVWKLSQTCSFHEHEDWGEMLACDAREKEDEAFIKGLISMCAAATDAVKASTEEQTTE